MWPLQCLLFVRQTGSSLSILEKCKFRIRFPLVDCGTITSVTRYEFRQILHGGQKYDAFYVWCFGNHKPTVDIRFQGYADSDFRCFGLWSAHFFQWIGTRFPTELKLNNADFVLRGKWDRKHKSDFMDVQIPITVWISVLWNDYAHNSLLTSTKFCTRLRNVVPSTPIVCETNRK